MAFPTNIDKSHLLKAIEKIDLEGIPKDGNSQYYDVVHKDKRYPPKVIVSYANLYANNIILERNSFHGGLGSPCFKLLEKNGFEIIKKLDNNSYEPNIWFVTQGATFTPDRGMKFLWAPKEGKNNTKRFYWDNVLKVSEGDIIFNYSHGIRGISIAKSDGYNAKNSDPDSSWREDGFKVDIDFFEFDRIIDMEEINSKKSEFDLALKEVKNKPFNLKGKVN